MAAHIKMLLFSVGVFASTHAFAAAYVLSPTSTGNGDYTFDISASAPTKGTFTDTFQFTIPGTMNGSSDLGVFNVAAVSNTGNIDFISGFLSGPSTNVTLSVANSGVSSSLFNAVSIPVAFGASYILSVTYKAAGANAVFNGNVAFSPAPEPATWAMLLLGFSFVGAGLRHAQRSRQKLPICYS
jgi:hypothetical protein